MSKQAWIAVGSVGGFLMLVLLALCIAAALKEMEHQPQETGVRTEREEEREKIDWDWTPAQQLNIRQLLLDYDTPNRLAADQTYVGKRWVFEMEGHVEVQPDHRGVHLIGSAGAHLDTDRTIIAVLNPSETAKAAKLKSDQKFKVAGRFVGWVNQKYVLAGTRRQCWNWKKAFVFMMREEDNLNADDWERYYLDILRTKYEGTDPKEERMLESFQKSAREDYPKVLKFTS